MTYAQPDYHAPQPTRTSGMSIASLVCGLLMCIPVVAPLLAIVFGILGINQAKDPQVRGRGMAIAGLVLGGVGILLQLTIVPAMLLPALSAAKERANRVASANNLKQIALGTKMYALDHRGNLPPDLGTLYEKHILRVNIFVSPRSDTVIPSHIQNGTTAEQAAWVNAYSDYVYLGAGKQDNLPANAIIAYEKLEHGTGDGTNVAFGDGSVEWVKQAEAQRLISQAR